jgi:hypothetical protein
MRYIPSIDQGSDVPNTSAEAYWCGLLSESFFLNLWSYDLLCALYRQVQEYTKKDG